MMKMMKKSVLLVCCVVAAASSTAALIQDQNWIWLAIAAVGALLAVLLPRTGYEPPTID